MEPAFEDPAPRPSRKPKYTKLTQQHLPACQPVLDPIWVIFIFLSISVLFIPIGGVCYAWGLKAKEVVYRYDNLLLDVTTRRCEPANTDPVNIRQKIWEAASNTSDLTPEPCKLHVPLPGKWESPIYVYYQLEGFYQNHRRYHKSRSDAQLANQPKPDLKTCHPKESNKDGVIRPCGLIAWSYFNDSYKVVETNSNNNPSLNFTINDKNIAPRADVKYRFANITAQNFFPSNENASLRGGGNITTTLKQDERFILWMRTAALPRFRKLWGRIDFKGDSVNTSIVLDVINQYNSYDFDGTKSLVFATSTWLGGRTRFLGLGYLITGGTSLLMATVYALLYAIKRPSLDDSSSVLSS